jgi:Raf kinase inhibitor-like YbhB/YbcL family protein
MRAPTLAAVRRPIIVAALVLIAACDSGDGRDLQEPTEDQRARATVEAATTTVAGSGPVDTAVSTLAPAPFTLTAPWVEGTPIDARYTCDGDDVSPALSWTAPPAGTVELVLVMSDDNVSFVHWAVTGIAAAAGSLSEGTVPAGAIEAVNDFGDTGWGGPCPPEGDTHTYRFRLYALTSASEIEPGTDAREVVTAVEALPSTVATVTGTYARA